LDERGTNILRRQASMKAIRIHQAGGPEVLQYEDVADPVAAAGQVLVKVGAVGVNYADIGGRAGAQAANLPMTPGTEAAGTVTAVGDGVTEFKAGDLVAVQGAPGCYAEQVAAPAARVVKLPAGMSAETGAATMLQGLTAHAMAFGACNVKSGDRVLVHAGAGGVGRLLIQMCKNAGAQVIATVGSDDKAAVAREAGADVVVNYSTQDFEEEVKKATDGKGVNAVFDSVGKATFAKGVNCLASRGVIAVFGGASGQAEPFDIAALARVGGYVTRTGMGHFTGTREEWLRRSNELLGWVQSGKLKLLTTTYPLARAADAHRDLQGRKTVGKLLLIP
jgi:NADPH2:quinone reductase